MSEPAYRPKKLVWKDDNSTWYTSITRFYFKYEVYKVNRMWKASYTIGIQNYEIGKFTSEEEAKAACQSHYAALWKQGGEAVV